MNAQSNSQKPAMRVLVTGGTGFLGSYILKELVERNYRVRAIRRATSKLPFYISPEILARVEWVEGDVLDLVSLEDALDNTDTIIHCAAVVSFHKNDRHQMYRVNVKGTTNAVNTAIEKKIAKFIHVSSVAALGRTSVATRVDEEKTWQNSRHNTHYAITKHRAEMEVWRGIGEGLDAIIVNPSTVLGFGDWNASSCRIFKTIYNEFPWYSTGINGFVDIEDVARATVLLMESNLSEQRFIINGDNWSFQQVFNTIADGFGKRRPRLRASSWLADVAWRLERAKSLFSNQHPLVTRESARVAHSRTFFSSDKLLAAIPQFSFTPLQETIRKACIKYLETINRRNS